MQVVEVVPPGHPSFSYYDLVASPDGACRKVLTSNHAEFDQMQNEVKCWQGTGCQLDLTKGYRGADLLDHYSDGGYLSLLAALALLPLPLLRSGGRALVIGGGAGEIPTTLYANFPGLRVDVVEPDATVTTLARAHFGFDHPVFALSGEKLSAYGPTRDVTPGHTLPTPAGMLQRTPQGACA